ncbi:hypothetical protein BS78_10G190700 [Paspalum vaginatum]|nr:hypothetical protein BS78_10G190700 [Paspalum vaginatum]
MWCGGTRVGWCQIHLPLPLIFLSPTPMDLVNTSLLQFMFQIFLHVVGGCQMHIN